MKKLLVVGSINMDLVTLTEKTPKIGETILGRSFAQIPGGKGANQAVAMARLGADVSMIGRVGDDSFGKTLMDGMKKDGLKIDGVEVVEGVSTGIATIIVDEEANNSIIVVAGANFEIEKRDLDRHRELYEKSDIVIHQLETPLEVVEESLKIAKSMGKTTILNPAPAKELSDEIIANIDYLIPNETELEILSGIEVKTEEDVLKAAKIVMDKGVEKLVVTLGSKGAMYIDRDSSYLVGAHKVEALDTTAAGDSFIGGLTTGLSKGMEFREAMEFAAKVGAITVTRRGAQTSLPTLEEVENFN